MRRWSYMMGIDVVDRRQKLRTKLSILKNHEKSIDLLRVVLFSVAKLTA